MYFVGEELNRSAFLFTSEAIHDRGASKARRMFFARKRAVALERAPWIAQREHVKPYGCGLCASAGI